MRAMFGLVDCNNFYCSCERVFNPELRTQPVVVLSNNDGCIIARSNEAKALGIEMGMPFYQAKELLEREKVAVFSSNYTLYGDMSRRVMMLLSEFTPELTQYSIDEAFIDLTGMGGGEALRDYGKRIVRTIGKGTGIPVTLGIAPTKTLAKVASRYGKKYKGYEGVCLIDTEEKRIKALQGFDIADVWGIGRRSAKKLEYYGVKTAWDFTQWSESRVRRLLTVTGTRTWKELRGENCIDISELPEKFPRQWFVGVESGGRSGSQLCSFMRPQTAGAKKPLQPTDSFCIHQPFPQRCAKPYHQPHCFIAHAHQRPVGVSGSSRASTPI